jgi:hypothetical protein
MSAPASTTGYYLNRVLRHLALVARDVRMPVTRGVWLRVADADVPRSKVSAMLSAVYREIEPDGLAFVAFLTEHDVLQFENSLHAHELREPPQQVG